MVIGIIFIRNLIRVATEMKKSVTRDSQGLSEISNTSSLETSKSGFEGEYETNKKQCKMFPPLKKTQNQDKDKTADKINEIGPSITLIRKTTEEEDRKCLTQNTCVVRKFNSRKKIEKKKINTNEFKPQLIIKYANLISILSYVNLSNNLKIVSQQFSKPYVLHVGKGNNGSLIKNIFKNYRPWWNIEEHDPTNPDINVHWYQLRQNHILQNFKEILKTDGDFEKCDYYLQENDIKQKTQKKEIRTNKRTQSSIRSQSLIKEKTAKLSMNKKESSKTKLNGKSSDKPSKISPLFKRFTVKELKEDVIGSQTQIPLKKPLTNPRMWPIYSNYRKIFCATDMKNLKSLNIIGEDGKIHGNLTRNKIKLVQQRSKGIVMHNHLENNWNLSNKKALFMNLKSYFQAKNINPFEYIPMTFHVEKVGDKEYEKFIEEYHRRSQIINLDEKNYKKSQYKTLIKPKKRNAWLIKPGQNTNRGIGIEVVESIEEIKEIIERNDVDTLGRPRTHIIQQYIMPFLYHRRKFDIRTYILVTSVNGYQKGYWYQDGYIRTASKDFNMKNLSNKFIHLTNDSVQKKSEDYGKYQPGNKLSFSDFQLYLDTHFNGDSRQKLKFWQQAYPQMKKLAGQAIRSVYSKMNSNKKDYCFEVFGLDYLIDENFKVWLIEANTNPCLEISAPLLGRLIPSLLENVFRIAIDPIFPPPPLQTIAKLTKKIILPDNSIDSNKFELIFDESQEINELKTIIKSAPELEIYNIEEQEEQYEEEEEKQNCL